MTEPNPYPPRVEALASTDALPVAPSLGDSLDAARMPRRSTLVDRRVVLISLVAGVIAAAAALIAQLLTALIGIVTNLAFYGRWSTAFTSPAGHHLGAWVVLVPVVGGLVVGVMARWGSRAIRGHGIPEAMEQVLLNESKIPPRITFLKPLSSAVAIGTGGPFGAEGPIIATGGALGSLFGQLLRVTATERKTLLAAVAAAGVRYAFLGNAPAFGMPHVTEPGLAAMACYVLLGALIGLVSVATTRIVYGIEDLFEKLPIHWMWWPAIGGVRSA